MGTATTSLKFGCVESPDGSAYTHRHLRLHAFRRRRGPVGFATASVPQTLAPQTPNWLQLRVFLGSFEYA
ncbi:hypothetical protein L596_027782 [Steinernema carpocapsae]|uniref:Uncharacterized protein n=1 Tax=Steinernema carpocapsae TaxID=34508 RepID=A0A4U5LWH7_STECR|nr:hypothetical protein L596_027782 [Steinernema carpocapsae]